MNRKQRRAGTKIGQKPATLPDRTADLLTAGLNLHLAGRLPEAEVWYRRLLGAQPDHADALNLLGVVADQTGRHDLAVELISKAIQRDGQNPSYFFNLGNVYNGRGKHEEAVSAYRRAINIKPDYAKAHYNLGIVLNELGRRDEALAAYRQTIRIKPDYAEAHCNLGIALNEEGKLDEAVAAYRWAIAVNPNYAEAHSNLAVALKKLGKLDEALAAYRRAIALQPEFAKAHYNLGVALNEQSRLDEAIAAYLRAISIEPRYAEAHYNLGIALHEQGRLDEALAAFRQAISVKADYVEAFSNLLFCLNYDDKTTANAIFAAHREWDEQFGHQAPRPHTYANDRDAGRRLKIGYFSPDFRGHSVAYFLEPLLKAHDRQAVEVFCYAEVTRPDAVTANFKALADRWLASVGLSDDELAKRVRIDGIDILVDLAGHSGSNRLALFARKPAPVQVTWLGYPNTTGLNAIDFRLVDAVADPLGEADTFSSETLVRLEGGFLCYGGLQDAPEPATPPCVAAGTMTFGSFNNPAKISASTLDAWAGLLSRLPNARLLLKGKPFADAGARALLLSRLGQRGVSAERVELMDWLPGATDHLELYKRVDIALDPFPYNGTTTTCEALWMGVPVVTLRGGRHAGRVGASLLTQVALPDLIANSVEEYVEIAAALASHPARLIELRHSLRGRMAASPLCDGPAFARKIEAAFRSMWQHWCAAPTRTPCH